MEKIRMLKQSASADGVFKKGQKLTVGADPKADVTAKVAKRFIKSGMAEEYEDAVATPYETASGVGSESPDGKIIKEAAEKILDQLVKAGRIKKGMFGWYSSDEWDRKKRKEELLTDIMQGAIKYEI